MKRISVSDGLFAVVVLALTFATARVWWLSKIVPGMDYPQFLLFVRALQDHTNPASPFHGTYTVGPWFIPTSLPVNLTSWLSYFCGHSIESAGKVMLALQNVSMVAASIYLLRVLGRSRWAVLLMFPLIHSVWTITGGFAAYSTCLPLNILAWALTVRWFERLDLRAGVALGVCLCANLLWHGVGFMQAGLAFATLWVLWRAPSWRARALSVVPTIPCLLQWAAWVASTFSKKGTHTPPSWLDPWEAAEKMLDHVWASVPHYQMRAFALFVIVGVGLLLSPVNEGASGPTSRMWRFNNPFLVLSVVYLAAYFGVPWYWNQVEGVGCRFAYIGAIAFVFAWNLPRGVGARAAVLAAVGGFAAWSLADMSQRFRGFEEYTRGASDLMDRVGLHETLYCSAPDWGGYKEFAGPTNKPIREIQQYASIRQGGLPNSSFAGYNGINYIRYVDNRNPMPGLSGGPVWSTEMTKFDYVLAHAGTGPASDKRFKLLEREKNWELYGVCGSERFPTCP